MLQPALTRPNGLAEEDSSPSYGDLIRATRVAVDEALPVATSKGLQAETIHSELLGYERFLITTAKHVQTLLTLAEAPPETHWQFNTRLNRRARPLSTFGAWDRAATNLGAAHDLLMTHLTGVLVPRTLEGQEIVLGPASAAACAEITGLLIEAIESSRTLMHRGMLAQKHRNDHPIPTQTFRRIRSANEAASLHARSTMWDLRHAGASGASLAELTPALLSGPAISEAFESALGALRVLRQFAHSQSRSTVPASAASLRDIAELGARFTDVDVMTLPAPANGLDAVQRAHALDSLEAAHNAWRQARSGLAESVRGVTRAPAAFSQAVRRLLTIEPSSRVQVAVLCALPRLGIDASQITHRLGSDGALVTRQRVPGELRAMWLPIEFERQVEVSERFARAATATVPAAGSVQDLERTAQRRSRLDSDRLHQEQQVPIRSRGGA